MDPNGVRSEWYYVPQPSQLPARLHHSTWVADRSLDFLQRRDPSRPFFLWSSFIKPHPPFESPIPWNRLYKPVEMPYPHMPPGYEHLLTFWNHLQNRYKYRDQGLDGNLVRLTRAAYYAAISFVDYNLGRILAQLRQSGQLTARWCCSHQTMASSGRLRQLRQALSARLRGASADAGAPPTAVPTRRAVRPACEHCRRPANTASAAGLDVPSEASAWTSLSSRNRQAQRRAC